MKFHATLTVSLTLQRSNRQLGLRTRSVGVAHGHLADRQVLFVDQEARIFSPARGRTTGESSVVGSTPAARLEAKQTWEADDE